EALQYAVPPPGRAVMLDGKHRFGREHGVEVENFAVRDLYQHVELVQVRDRLAAGETNDNGLVEFAVDGAEREVRLRHDLVLVNQPCACAGSRRRSRRRW